MSTVDKSRNGSRITLSGTVEGPVEEIALKSLKCWPLGSRNGDGKG